METKKSRTGLHVFLGIMLAILICGGVVFASYSLGYLTFNKEETINGNVEENEDDITTEPSNNNTYEDLGFDSSKVTNANGNTYTLTVPSHATGINISLDEAGTKATLGINNALVNETYALGWTVDSNNYTYDLHEITFNQKVTDIFFGGIGQDATGDIILFLMEDGTVEYIPVKQALSKGIDNLRSYRTISGISDVVKFYQASVSVGTSGANTVLVQTKDGRLYDLSSIINNTNNNQ